MPLYEYRCVDCGHEFEILQKVDERPKRTCQECKGKLEKLVSRTSFQLKGGGWFAHGYTNGGGKKSGGSSGGSSSGSSGSSGSSSSSGGGSSSKAASAG